MKTYIHTSIPQKGKYNRRIKVWRIKHNQPLFVGCKDICTGSYKGDYATACEVISTKDGHALTDCGYFLKAKDIRVVEI